MEAGARLSVLNSAFRLIACILVCSACQTVDAASFRTQNFIIQAPTPQLARAVGESAERYRHDLSVHWTGEALPAWPTPCPIRVIAGPNLAAQGVTTYNPRPVRDFQMEVVGTPERILDSVLPHEVTHTILATYFGRPLPRWADEGICTTVEHVSERSKHEAKLREFLRNRRGIAMNQLFLLTEYPSDVLPMYAQGYSVCNFLIAQKDARTFVQFLGDYMKRPSWTANIKKHYGYDSLAELQEYWLAWVESGSGPVGRFAKVDTTTRIASNQLANNQRTSNQLAGVDRSRVVPASASSSQNMRLDPPKQSRSAQSDIAMSNNSTQLNTGPAKSTTLASSTNGGWYSRQRNAAKNLAPSDSPKSAVTALVPPSVRNSGRYSSAQPQGEQPMRRTMPAQQPSHSVSGNYDRNLGFR
jgi:hypothetical protein